MLQPAQTDVIQQHTRARIYDYVKAHPGVHIRAMQRELGIASGDMAYHLWKLTSAGLVKKRRLGLRTCVFVANLFGEKQEVLLGFLSLPAPREVLLCILENPDITQKELAERLKRSVPTVWWHVDRLARLGVISRRRQGKAVTYRVIASPNEVLGFIRHYQPGVWEKWASSMHDISLMLASEQDNTAPE